MTLLSTFLAANPGTNLQDADLFSAEALAQYNWPDDADQKILLQDLRIRQRLLKLYPDNTVAEKLESLGIHSAHHIASLGNAAFAENFLPELETLTGISDPENLCRKIFSKAEKIRRRSMELAIAAPASAKLAADPLEDSSNPDFQEGIPDYQRLFGPMLTCDCEDCMSIFGPAAYFTDLMRVISDYITQPTENSFKLQFRRPDLWKLPLDCLTATAEVSYLDIVNAALLQNLGSNYTHGADPVKQLASMVYPFAAPFNQSLLNVRGGMEGAGTSLAALYKLLNTQAPAAASENLNLSPEQLSLITGAKTVVTSTLYGFHDSSLVNKLEDQAVFLEQTGLSPEQLQELVCQNFKQGDDGYAMQDNGSQDVGTVSFSDPALTGSITLECWLYPTAHYTTMSVVGKTSDNEFCIYLDNTGNLHCSYVAANSSSVNFHSAKAISLNAWTHIAWTRNVPTGKNYLYINGVFDSGHSYGENLTARLSTSSISIGFTGGTSYHGAISELRLWTTVRTNAQIKAMMYSRLKNYTETGLYAYWPLNEMPGSLAQDLGPHQYNAGYPVFALYESLPLGSPTEINPELMHGFFLNNLLPSGEYVTIVAADYESQTGSQLKLTTGSSLSTISDTALQQMAVYIRLQAQTGWTFAELDWLLKSVVSILNIPTQVTINNAIIESVGQVAALSKKYNICIDELSSFWYDMKTYGRGNGAEPEDLWDRVFNTPPLMAGSENSAQPDYYRPQYNLNPLFSSPVLTWAFSDSVNSQDQRLSNQLAAALEISSEDLYAIVNSLIVPPVNVLTLTVPQLSQFYRIARFAKMLNMRVPDFIQLTSIAGHALASNKTNWTIGEVISICEKAEWMKKARLNIDQLAYLTSVNPPATNLRLPDSSTVDKALSDLTKSSAQVLVTPASFVNDRIDASTALAIYNQLVAEEVIDSYGLVLINEFNLTTNQVYNWLSSDPQTADQVFPLGYKRSYVNFSSSSNGNACLPFDPFANETIQQTNSFTISFWVSPKYNSVSGWPRILGNNETTGTNNTKSPSIYQQQNVPTGMQVDTAYNNNFYAAGSNYFENADEWVFLSWVNDHGNWKVYRNGNEIPFTSPQNTVPGIYQQTGSSPTYYIATDFSGAICNLSIWTIPRTVDQIRSDMVNPDYSNLPGLLGWWPMNEGSGITINDRSGNSEPVNGTLSNSYTWVTESSQAGLAQAEWISNLLKDALAAQNLLVVKTLAPIAGVSSDTMSGICFFTSGEVDNSGIFTNPIYSPYPYSANMLLNPASQSAEVRETYLSVLQRNAAMTRWFKLTGQEIGSIIGYSQLIGNKSVTYGTQFLDIDQLMTLSDYKALQNLCNQTNGLLEYFRLAVKYVPVSSPDTPVAQQLTLLSQLTGWNLDELNAIVVQTYFVTADPDTSVNFNTVAGLRKIADVMAMESKTGMGIVSLNMLRGLSVQNLFGPYSTNYWGEYTDAAAAVSAMLDTKSGAEAVNTLNVNLAEQLRNILCDWLIWELKTSINGVRNRNELYEYMLIDVNMSASVKTSWLVAGMNSLQLYVNRCISSLEPGIVNKIPTAWWDWMSTYRVWQANREVYLYPENYVDPSLRKFQSIQFKQFVSDVSKGQITDDNVSKALAAYLESVAEVSSLELVDVYVNKIREDLPGANPENEKNVIFMIGKSRTEPAVFYSRTSLAVTSENAVSEGVDTEEATYMDFGPWQQINLQINSAYVSTAVAFGRQFIFWVEQSQIINTDSDNKKYTSVYATIYYSYRDFTDTWIEPAILKKDILIEVFGKHISTHFYNSYLVGATLDNPATDKAYPYYTWKQWNKVTLQVLPATSKLEEQILVLLGDMAYCPATQTNSPDQQDTSDMPDEAAEYQDLLYQAAVFARRVSPHYTTIIPACTLNSGFQKNTYPVWFKTNSSLFVDYSGFTNDDVYEVNFYTSSSPLLSTVSVPTPENCWPMTQNLGFVTGKTLKDAIGTDDGTLYASPTWFTPGGTEFPNLELVNYAGSNYGYIPAVNFIAQTKFTISCWVYLNSTGNQNILTMMYRSSTSSTYSEGGWDISVHSGKFQFGYGRSSSSGGENTTNAFGTVALHTWYYLALSVNGTNMMATINDTQYSMSGSYSPITFAVTNPYLYLGNACPSGSGYFNTYYNKLNGTIANLKYWETVLDLTHLKQEYLSRSMEYYGTNPNPSLQRIGNSFAAFLYNNGGEAYLCLPDFAVNQTKDCVHPYVTNQGTILEINFPNSPVANILPVMKLIRINTDTLPFMIRSMATNGVDGLLGNLTMQTLPEMPPLIQSATGQLIPPDSDMMNFNGAFGIYFWEIFFYVPYLIAEKLRSSQNFAEAQNWYQYIFTPTSEDKPALSEEAEFSIDNIFADLGSQNGPVAYWPMNAHTGSTFPDLKKGFPATYVKEGLTQNKHTVVPFATNPRTVWGFDPANTTFPSVQVATNTPELNTASFSISCWVKMAGVAAYNQFYSLFTSQDGYNGYQLALWGNSSGQWSLQLVIGNGTAWNFCKSPYYDLSTDEWFYMAATYDGSRARVFINGKDVSQSSPVTITNYHLNTTKPQVIGSGNSNSVTVAVLKGEIAEVAYFNHALSVSLVDRLYKDYLVLYRNSNFWNFRPFRRLNGQSLYHILNGDAWEESYFQPAAYYTASLQMVAYEYDPFDPDAIARLRVNSWQKATFMRYVQNLISWGDKLFTEDTWETLSDASMRYVLASTLLGRVPVKTIAEDPQPTVNYGMIETEYGAGNVPPFLIEMENQLSGLGADATLPQQVQSIIDAYFCIPTNKQMLQYWELVADRLYKIRHGLTITGAQNDIPLFAAPIDPNALIAAAASGVLSNASSNLVPPVPWFRFSYMIAQAKSLTAEVSRLGSELLAALEKQDAEHLAQLQANYQVVLYNLSAQVKASQINQLVYVGEGLKESLANAEYMHDTYKRWMFVPMGPLEIAAMGAMAVSLISQDLAMGIRLLSSPAYLIPDIYGLADGGMQFGDAIAVGGIIAEGVAQVAGTEGQMLTQMSQYVRRELEWDLQKNIAGNQAKEIKAQIKANEFALQAAKQEMGMNSVQLQQSQEVVHFLQTKFTNEELYSWMAGQVSALYFQSYQLAWSLAQSAQTALQYELNLSQNYLNPASWNSNYQGLVAADSLSLSLQQMENAYINGNSRKLAVRKTWSMRQNNPQALTALVANGNCRFALDELLYDMDFPGQYNRKIKTISVTIPAVVGPYQNIHATLTQTGNTVVVKPSVAAVEYLVGQALSMPTDGSLRMNWNPNQQIVISTGISDSGVFQVNFADEQYLPFEGTGAVSSWELNIPQAANAFPLRSISDVILTIDYTSEDGGSTYAQSLISTIPALSKYNGWQYISLRQLYSGAWFDFCNNPAAGIYSLAFPLVPQQYPANLESNTIRLGDPAGEILLLPVLEKGLSSTILPQINLNNSTNPWSSTDKQVNIGTATAPVSLPVSGTSWTITAQDFPENGLLTENGKIDPTKLLDIVLIVPFSGDLDW